VLKNKLNQGAKKICLLLWVPNPLRCNKQVCTPYTNWIIIPCSSSNPDRMRQFHTPSGVHRGITL